MLIEGLPTTRTRAHARIEGLLNLAGVAIDGNAPTDMRVHDPRLYSRILAHGSLGLGEAYMDGWWDTGDLDGFLFRLLDTRLDERVGGFEDAWLYVKSRFFNLQRGRRAYEIGERHYDLGNDLFEAMLGKRLVYSCGYWKDASDLDSAQEAKLDLIFRKLGLKPGMRAAALGAPKQYTKLLGPTPGVEVRPRLAPNLDFIHAFFRTADELAGAFPRLKKSLAKSGSLWMFVSRVIRSPLI